MNIQNRCNWFAVDDSDEIAIFHGAEPPRSIELSDSIDLPSFDETTISLLDEFLVEVATKIEPRVFDSTAMRGFVDRQQEDTLFRSHMESLKVFASAGAYVYKYETVENCNAYWKIYVPSKPIKANTLPRIILSRPLVFTANSIKFGGSCFPYDSVNREFSCRRRHPEWQETDNSWEPEL